MKSLVKRFCVWCHSGEEPCWYLHREQTTAGQWLNFLAKIYHSDRDKRGPQFPAKL